MLKSLDILIGFTMVMLIASMAVTVLTQIWTALLNSRGTHLREGVADLIAQLSNCIAPAEANAVASHILTHPLVREGARRLGTVLHKDELIRFLMESVAAEGVHTLPAPLCGTMRNALARLGIHDPDATLRRIDDAALALAQEHPALSHAARQEMAILKTAPSELVAKVNTWFDRSMDRVSGRFTITARRVAFANAVLIAALIQIDSVALLNRLAANDALRNSLIERAQTAAELGSMDPHKLALLTSRDLFPVPHGAGEWVAQWRLTMLPGVALSVLLLSLGAPFWFEALKNMLRLRNLVNAPADAKPAKAVS